MKALIIGAGGFVGGYLIDELIRQGDEVYATDTKNETLQNSQVKQYFHLDILDLDQITDVLTQVNPDVIYHLAAQSSVKVSWAKPQLTAQVNIVGAINLFEAVRAFNPKIKILVVGSSEEYGAVDYSQAVAETVVPQPTNIYALTKLSQEHLANIYFRAYGLPIILTRSFNHIGPKQLPQFVVADFCQQVANIEKGLQKPVIRVGNLTASRDFTDVRDVVKAYALLIQKGKPGEVYNIGSGQSVKIQTVLDSILQNSTAKITVEKDEGKFRPVDVPEIKADITKLSKLGWKRKYQIFDSILDVLNYYRY